jgi:hypothetical protein
LEQNSSALDVRLNCTLHLHQLEEPIEPLLRRAEPCHRRVHGEKRPLRELNQESAKMPTVLRVVVTKMTPPIHLTVQDETGRLRGHIAADIRKRGPIL